MKTNYCQGCGNHDINSHTQEYSGWTFCNLECADTFKEEINLAIPDQLKYIGDDEE
tara:strand:- start:3027 stop:3194 length:168 start_codon:yes stop_codon:yes gene_type:complete